jgi:hypothetical protein
MEKWTDDEEVMKTFEKLMVDMEVNMNRFMRSLAPYFENTPNSMMIRLLGFAVHYYNQGVLVGLNEHDAYNQMLQQLSTNTLAQQLFQQFGNDMMNKAVGV